MKDIINEIGATAFIIAAYRALEKDADAPLFEDGYSEFFVNEQVIQKALDFEKVLPEGREMIRYRIKFFGDKTADAVTGGVRQVIMLGSGFDMRAGGYQDDDVVFFDVDQSAVLAFKQQVIEKNNIPYRANFVPCNYADEDLFAKLAAQGLDPDAPTLITWEGNTMYLPEETVVRLLNDFCDNLARFAVTFDYLDKCMVMRTSGFDSITKAAEFFDKMSATWVTGFDDLKVLEQKTPLKVVEDRLMKNLREEYSPGAEEPMAVLNFYSVAVMEKQ